MKSEEKRMILILIVVAVVIIGCLFIWKNSNSEKAETNKGQEVSQTPKQEEEKEEEFVQDLDDGSKLNVSEKLQESKNIDGLEITNIQLREVNGITTLLADVQNKSNSQTELKTVKIEILDKSGNVITDLIGVIDPIPAQGKVQLNAGVTADVANAYDFRISKP